MASVSWAGRLAQRGVADLAVVLSVEAQSATATAAAAQLGKLLGRPLRLMRQSLPAGDDAGKPSQTDDLVIELAARSAPGRGPPRASHTQRRETGKRRLPENPCKKALKTLPSRVWQASIEAREPELTLLVDRPMSELIT